MLIAIFDNITPKLQCQIIFRQTMNIFLKNHSFLVATDYAKEMVFITPPVFILMGLLEVWIPKDKIQQWLGSSSGLKGILISFVIGTLPTGPLYIAIPMSVSLLKKVPVFPIWLFFSALGLP